MFHDEPGGLTTRRAGPDDADRLAALMFLAPTREHISLTTATDNPARRLYERSGYRVTGEKTNARYERITGSAGRVLMVKPTRAS